MNNISKENQILLDKLGNKKLTKEETLEILSTSYLYKNMINDWDKIFPEIKLTITTDVTIRRIGEETFHSKKT